MYYQWANCCYAGEMKSGYKDRELSETIAYRPPVPDDVFCYPDVASWRGRIWTLLGDILTEAVKDKFKRDPPKYVVCDDLTWLNEIVFAVEGIDIEMKSLTTERLAQEYRAFRAGHATRTNDLAQFYEGGLQCLRADEAEERARTLFVMSHFPWVTDEKFEAAVADVNARNTSGGREGSLYFCADECALITRLGGSGHYLVYGSEYIYCLGIRLVGTFEAKKVLKSVGRPTMFVCDIPIKSMRENTLGEFAGLILEFLFCELIGEQSYALGPGAGSALSLTVDLSPENIVGHYHPARIHDPL
ncbi:MAG: hypothetical protein BGO57_04100 [Sphingomonadales bacterium 63-6]|nr:MAG: hypothetical protein BGO57_04100 [Sphingomonadales bacterium 63-6]